MKSKTIIPDILTIISFTEKKKSFPTHQYPNYHLSISNLSNRSADSVNTELYPTPAYKVAVTALTNLADIVCNLIVMSAGNIASSKTGVGLPRATVSDVPSL